MESDTYLTIRTFSEGIYKEKGSRFLAYAAPVNSTGEIGEITGKIKKEHHSARHHCYAWMLGSDRQNWRVNDDGEPSGTAGKPILGQINSFGLTNILIVVTRYFGGRLLGTSGLINAYKTAAEDAIRHAEVIEMTVHDHYEIRFPWTAMNDVMRLIKEENLDQSGQKFETVCTMNISFRHSIHDKITGALRRIEGLTYIYLGTN